MTFSVCSIAAIFSCGLRGASGAERAPLIFLGDKDYPPVAYLEDGMAKGMDVDLAKAVAAQMKRGIRIELMDWNLAQEKVLKGEADGLLGLSISDERRKLYDFAAPTFNREFGIVVRSGEISIRGATDLKGKRVAVTRGGFPRTFLEAQPGISLVFVDNYGDGLNRLMTGTVDALAADLWVAAHLIEKGGIRGVSIVGKPFATAQGAIAVKKGNAAILNEINQAIDALKTDGTISKIQDNWRPHEMLFASRERVRSFVTLALAASLAILLAAMGLWVFTLKKQMRIRRKAESALRESDERFQLAVRGSNDGLWDWHVQTDEVYYAPRFRELLGYDSPAEFPPTVETFYSHLHPEDVERTRAAVQEHLAQRTPYDIEYRLCSRRGEYRWFRARGQAIWNEQGQAVRMAGSITDITKRKEAEQSLRESEERYRTVVEFSPECVAVAVNDRLVYLNPAGAKMIGAEGPAQLMGRSVYDFLAADFHELIRERRRAVLESGLPSPPFEGPLLRLGGGLIFVEAIAVPFVFRGQPAILNLVRDVTERKRSEAERQRTAAREEQAHMEYTRQLIASQEAERTRIAAELHDSLGQDLLLIKNRVQIALGSAPQDRTAQLEAINSLASRAVAEVRQISRDLRPYQLDHLGLTRALEAMIDGAAQSSGVTFERKLDLADDALSAEAATNLYRIVQESLNNILKHSRARRARIELERDVREIILRIEDDGDGFDVKSVAGAGFGLRNMTERVHILDGALKVDSHPSRGTRIEVTIPIEEESKEHSG